MRSHLGEEGPNGLLERVSSESNSEALSSAGRSRLLENCLLGNEADGMCMQHIPPQAISSPMEWHQSNLMGGLQCR